jgi:hypothetical protein
MKEKKRKEKKRKEKKRKEKRINNIISLTFITFILCLMREKKRKESGCKVIK